MYLHVLIGLNMLTEGHQVSIGQIVVMFLCICVISLSAIIATPKPEIFTPAHTIRWAGLIFQGGGISFSYVATQCF